MLLKAMFFVQFLLRWHLIRKKIHCVLPCPYSELFWSAFSRIRTEYEEIRSICLYSVRMRENADKNNSKYGHVLRCVKVCETFNKCNVSLVITCSEFYWCKTTCPLTVRDLSILQGNNRQRARY